MKKLIYITFALLFFSVVATPSHAAIDLLFSGVVNKLEDNDWDAIINADGSVNASGQATITAGDILFGMYEIQAVVNNTTNAVHPVTTTTFTGVFAQKVATSVPGGIFGGGITSTFVPLTAAEYTALQAIFPAMPLRSSTGTLLWVYDDTGTPGTFVDPDSGAVGGPGTLADINASLLTAVNGTPLWEIGFRDGDELFRADADTNVLVNTSLLDFRAWMNITFTYPGGSTVTFGDHQTVPFFGSNLTSTAIPSEYQLRGSLEQGGTPGDFAIPTDTDAFVLPFVAPEPGSLALFAGLFAIGAVATRRRLRVAA